VPPVQCIVEKDSFAKLKDYSIRALGTPVTIVIDTTAIFIIALAYGTVNKTIEDERDKACQEDPFCDDEPWQ